MDKVVSDPLRALGDLRSGASLAVGGFGVCGIPMSLINAVLSTGAGNLTVVSNNCGTDDVGLGVLLKSHRISRVVASYVGENAEFARQYLAGEIELEFTPQGSLAERLRAGGCGIPAFYTLAGVGTVVAEGGLPIRYGADGAIIIESKAKETRVFNGKTYVLEDAIRCDFALVHAAIADRAGNLRFNKSARNFNPLCAMAGDTTIVEAEEIVETGEIDPDLVHLPGIYVQHVVPTPVGQDKPIERRTVRSGEVAKQ